MFAYFAGRRFGKTKMVIDWFFEAPDHRGIVVATPHDAMRIQKLIMDRCHAMGVTEQRCKYWRQHVFSIVDIGYGASLRGRGLQWAVDDIDRVLACLLGDNEPGLITGTATLVPSPPPQPGYVDSDATEAQEDDTRSIESHRALTQRPQATTHIVIGPGRYNGLDV